MSSTTLLNKAEDIQEEKSTELQEEIVSHKILVNFARKKGMKQMLSIAKTVCKFNAKTYLNGTNIKKSSEDTTFLNCFNKWKESVSVSDEEKEQWLEMLDKWVNFYATKTIKENKKARYGECIAFLAAYGETMESLGEEDEKQALLRRYVKSYPHDALLYSEVREYGMKF